MPVYTLVASKTIVNGAVETTVTRSVRFAAADDTDATFEALHEVMSRSYPHREPWATGRIILADESGRIVRTKEAK